jgi:SAM-dependent methyltransferase
MTNRESDVGTDDSTTKPLLLAVSPRDLGPAFVALEIGSTGPCAFRVPDAAAGLVILEGLGQWTEEVRLACLAEINRVLQPGGLLRVATPDLDAVVNAYLFDERSEQGLSRATRLNVWRLSVADRFVFNEEELRTVVEQAGFVDLRRFLAGSGSLPILWDLEGTDSVTIVLEARKPLEKHEHAHSPVAPEPAETEPAGG